LKWKYVQRPNEHGRINMLEFLERVFGWKSPARKQQERRFQDSVLGVVILDNRYAWKHIAEYYVSGFQEELEEVAKEISIRYGEISLQFRMDNKCVEIVNSNHYVFAKVWAHGETGVVYKVVIEIPDHLFMLSPDKRNEEVFECFCNKGVKVEFVKKVST
jgi:hypothetical protein